MLVDVLGLVPLIYQEDRGVIVVVADATPDDLVNFPDRGDLVPVVAHDPQRRQLTRV